MTLPSLIDQLISAAASPEATTKPGSAPRRSSSGKRLGRPPGPTADGLIAYAIAWLAAHPGEWKPAELLWHFNQGRAKPLSRTGVGSALREAYELGLIGRVFVPNERIPQKSCYAYFAIANGATTEVLPKTA
jgi:hypothetical protein